MLKYYETIVQITLRSFSLLGINSKGTNKLFVILIIFLLSTMYILDLMAIVYEEHTFEKMCDYISTFLIVNHHFVYFAALVAKRRQLFDLVQGMEEFWPIDSEEFRPEFTTALSRSLRNFKMMLYVLYSYVILVACLAFPFLTLYLRIQIFKCYVPEFLPITTILFFEIIYCITLTPLVAGFDFYFITVMFLIKMQFTILNEHLRLLDYESTGFGCMLKRCVNHHNFLLRYCQKVGDAFSTTLLLFLWHKMLMSCFALYSISENVDESMVANVFVLFFVQFELLFIFFLPTQALTDEITKTAESVYFSDWYGSGSPHKSSLVATIMIRGQRETVISAGNFMPMNLQTCTAIFKTTSSFFTFLQNMKVRQQGSAGGILH